MESALRTVPQGAVTQALAWDKVVSVAAELRRQHPGLRISEIDVLAFCAAQAATKSPRLRSVLAGEATLREYRELNLGFAVHIPGDDLTTAVVRGANTLSFSNFVRAVHAQFELAQAGADHASHDTQLLITHLGGLPITQAMPMVIPPAAGVLFISAPDASGQSCVINLTLAFDHRILNGAAAARFLRGIIRRLGKLGENSRAVARVPVAFSSAVAPAAPVEG